MITQIICIIGFIAFALWLIVKVVNHTTKDEKRKKTTSNTDYKNKLEKQEDCGEPHEALNVPMKDVPESNPNTSLGKTSGVKHRSCSRHLKTADSHISLKVSWHKQFTGLFLVWPVKVKL